MARPKPQEQKALEGNPGKRPLNMEAPDYEVDDKLKCPRILTGEGRKEWERLAPMLVEYGTIKKSDLRLFEEYCMTVSELDTYKRKAGKEKSLRIKLQLQDMVLKLRTQFRMLAVELGLSPSSRGTIKSKRPTGRQTNDGNDIKTPKTGNLRFFKKARQ